VREAQKLEELQALVEQLDRMLTVHQRSFPVSERPVAPPPEPADVRALERARRKEQRRGIPLYRLSNRRAARRRARELAEEDARREAEARESARAQTQAEYDAAWQRLLENDRPTVLATLEASFADNEAPAVAVNCEDGRVTIVMLMESEEAVPERRPTVTPTGRPSSKKLNQTERSELYQAWISSNLLATVKEAFAVAPGLRAATVVVLRRSPPNPFGEVEVDAVYCGTFSRERFEKLRFEQPGMLDAIFHAEDVRLNAKGRSKRMAPIDLSKDEELRDLVAEVRRSLASSPASSP
jgi:hypothetical protein